MGVSHAQRALEERFAFSLNGDFNDDKKLTLIRDFIVKEFGFRSQQQIGEYVANMLIIAGRMERKQSLLDKCLVFIHHEQLHRQKRAAHRRR